MYRLSIGYTGIRHPVVARKKWPGRPDFFFFGGGGGGGGGGAQKGAYDTLSGQEGGPKRGRAWCPSILL